MAKTLSNMLPLHTIAPDFTLFDTVSQQTITCSTYRKQQPLLVAFICNHCPFVVHIIGPLTQLINASLERGLCSIAISSNDSVTHPQDAPEHMTTFANRHQFHFPYCYDETQTVAKQYQAACTPEFYLFNAAGALVYRGRFDAATPGNDAPVTGDELQHAIDTLLNNQPMPETQHPSLGCNIKWIEN